MVLVLVRCGSQYDGTLGHRSRMLVQFPFFSELVSAVFEADESYAGGHQAFSPSKRINNAVGFVLHSLLLVPYHSWRISHARHHASTGHMTRDEVFVPKTRSQVVKPVGQRKTVKKSKSAAKGVLVEMEELLEDAPIYRLAHLLFQQVSRSLQKRNLRHR